MARESLPHKAGEQSSILHVKAEGFLTTKLSPDVHTHALACSSSLGMLTHTHTHTPHVTHTNDNNFSKYILEYFELSHQICQTSKSKSSSGQEAWTPCCPHCLLAQHRPAPQRRQSRCLRNKYECPRNPSLSPDMGMFLTGVILNLNMATRQVPLRQPPSLPSQHNTVKKHIKVTEPYFRSDALIAQSLGGFPFLQENRLVPQQPNPQCQRQVPRHISQSTSLELDINFGLS